MGAAEEAAACLKHGTEVQVRPRGQGSARTAAGSQHVGTDLRPPPEATGWVPESCLRPQGGVQARLLGDSGSQPSSRGPSPPEAKTPEKRRCARTFLQWGQGQCSIAEQQQGFALPTSHPISTLHMNYGCTSAES